MERSLVNTHSNDEVDDDVTGETPQDEEIEYPDLDSDQENIETPEPLQATVNLKKQLFPEKSIIASSPLLHPHERREAKELGYSLDTKLLNDEFFYIDLEKM